MAAQTCAGVAEGRCCRTSAAAPATWGAAIDVPLNTTDPVFEAWLADRIWTPGAKRSLHRPKLENVASSSFRVDAATVIAAGTRAGLTVQVGAASLPAATATVTPSWISFFTARSRLADGGPPKLMLATAGCPNWWSRITQLMPVIKIVVLV